jgi:hypothetical protein
MNAIDKAVAKAAPVPDDWTRWNLITRSLGLDHMKITVDLVYGLVVGDPKSPQPPQRIEVEIDGLLPLILKAIDKAGLVAPRVGVVKAHVVVTTDSSLVISSLVT